MPKLRVLDLFSGIGGFSLGLERTGGFETVAFCEIESFCRRVLAKHWPEVPCYEDVRSLTAAQMASESPMSSVADSLARTLAVLDKALALTVLAPDSGSITPVLLAKYGHNTHSWRTSALFGETDLTEFSGTWPRSGMVWNGTAYQLPPLVRLIPGIGSGLWPTPRKCSGKNSAGMNRAELYRAMGFAPSSSTKGGATRSPPGGALNPAWAEWYMGFPTGWTDLEQ